jgi:hypothetical protein
MEVAPNAGIFSKQPRTADTAWSSSLKDENMDNNSTLKYICYEILKRVSDGAGFFR